MNFQIFTSLFRILLVMKRLLTSSFLIKIISQIFVFKNVFPIDL